MQNSEQSLEFLSQKVLKGWISPNLIKQSKTGIHNQLANNKLLEYSENIPCI
jgi:hypothetical protein